MTVGSSVTSTALRRVPVPMVNISDQECLIRKGTTVAIMRPTDLADFAPRVEAVAASPNELKERVGRRPRRLERDVPEHVKVLLEGISSELSLQQREELAAAITDYADVFSSGKDDMGCTDLVQHQIDTGEARPIRQPPRRLPIAKQSVEKNEVENM